MLSIKQLRKKIDKIDTEIIKKLAERKKISKEIGKLKAKIGKQIKDLKREQQLEELYEKLCTRYKLDPAFVKKLFKTIIKNSRNIQK